MNRLRNRLALGAFSLIVLILASACGGEPAEIAPPATPIVEAETPATPEPPPALQPQLSASVEPTVLPTSTPSPVLPTPTPAAATLPPAPSPPQASPTPSPSPTPEPLAARPASPALATVTPPPASEPTDQRSPAPDRDLYDLALRLRPVDETPAPQIAATSSGPLEVGQEDTFLITSLVDGSSRPINATLKVVSEHAYWYVDNNVGIPVQDLETSARIFEERVHPAVVGTFGDIWNPGIDGDPHLYILHANLSGAAGYYGSKDEFPRQVHPSSNEREIIYMDARSLKPGSDLYMGILAHELQHAVHWNQDVGEEAWVNEGLSEVATGLAGYKPQSPDSFFRRPDTQLNWWPDQLQSSFPHYGASVQFFTYLSQHYGGPEGLGQLVREQLDGVQGVNAYLSQYGTTFAEVFQDWVVANYLDAPAGPYGYPNTDVSIQDILPVTADESFRETQPQFSAQYYDLTPDLGDTVTVSFQGDTTVRQIGDGCHGGTLCWWGGMGDSIDSTLTRRFDLSALTEATLEFSLWYDIERGWDFAYVEASGDDGQTWDILQGPRSTMYNPSGNGYGYGYTGSSGVWVDEFADLTPYAGGEVLIRFEYVTDDAAYLDGLVLDNIAVPELGFLDDAESSAGWEARGFNRIDGSLRQLFAVQLLEVFEDDTFRVTPMELDENNAGQMVITALGAKVKQAVLIVSPLTDGTRHSATFDLDVKGS